VSASAVGDGIGILSLLTAAGIAPSNGEARRLVQQNGIEVKGEKVTDIKVVYTPDDFTDGSFIVKKGKKVYRRIVLV
jgi:tyrosyl-tRNA synthetase